MMEVKILGEKLEDAKLAADSQAKMTAKTESTLQSELASLRERVSEAQSERDRMERMSIHAAGEASELLAASKDREKTLAVELAETRAGMTSANSQAADLRDQLTRE